MDTDGGRQFAIHPSMRVGYVSLNVSDLDRSLAFYKSVLGFKEAGRFDGKALLSVDGNPSHHHLVELSQASDRETAKRAGLYHFAVLLPERKHLAELLVHLGENRDRVHFDGLADHRVSESIYIRDPDLLGIEIYCDRPASQWTWNGSRVQMATERLDTEGLVKEATESWEQMPAGTVIGHVHLHVRDLERAKRFYSGALGLSVTAAMQGASFFAAGKYHHHIATNTWLGTDIKPALHVGAGLNHFGIELPAKALEETAAHLVQQDIQVKKSQGSAFLQDNDGIAIRLYARPT
jgi:catechol 2,3-dioxygenase